MAQALSIAKVSGGNISVGTGGTGLEAYGGTIDLFGTGFTDGNGTPFAATITSGPGIINGKLLNGQNINTSYGVDNAGIIEFIVGTPPAPEPSQSVALGLGICGLVGLSFRARRKAITA